MSFVRERQSIASCFVIQPSPPAGKQAFVTSWSGSVQKIMNNVNFNLKSFIDTKFYKSMVKANKNEQEENAENNSFIIKR